MSSPQRHPRRRPVKDSSEPHPTHTMSLRKGNTFSSPKPDASDICSLENHRFMSRRSPTSSEDLEALVQGCTRVNRVSEFLRNFDNTINGSSSESSSSNYTSLLNDPEVLPLPQFMLESHTPMDIDSPSPQQQSSHDHASDSGLGSSVTSKDGASLRKAVSSTHTHYGGVNGHADAHEEKHTLSSYACEQIKEAIINPILKEPTLKEFHPLIQDVPRRIGEKSICNLRDLEKTLIFLAPVSGIRYLSEDAKINCIRRGFKEFSATSDSYFRFCSQTIRLLQATVDALPERDQKLPTDRPYTSNYFLDLIEQIRRYAEIMAATRRKEQQGDKLDAMDYSRYASSVPFSFGVPLIPRSDEKITLRGGLSHNGRPLELVREKDGQVIPIVEGAEKAHTGFSSSKRALSDDEMDVDEATRSMARRRKSEKPGDILHLCRDCKKEFKRPCDLTKHEKTHSRPWKCTEEKCKYFDLGWPTEKERDRHVNDKHSAAPAQYKCLYPPCTYASKRESNCKQHMEKAHGWVYVRSKSNGRKKAQASSAGSDRAPPTPLTPFVDTPQSMPLSTPITPFIPSPSVPVMGFDYSYGLSTPAMPHVGFQEDFRRDSTTTDVSNYTYSSGHSPLEPTSFEDAVTPEDTAINHGDVFGNCDFNNTDFSNAFQQPTPASTGLNFDPQYFPMLPGSGNMQHVSPSGQADMTLYSPPMHIDEGFGDSMDATFQPPPGDFTLFQSTSSNDLSLPNDTANFFPDITMLGGQFDNFYIPPSSAFDDIDNFDFTCPQ